MPHSDFVFGFSGGSGSLPFFVVAIIAIVLVSSWVILAGSRFVQGGVVEHPERVPQLYGYTVCLVALLVAFASFKSVVDSMLTLANPAYAADAPFSGWGEPSVTSFEAFRVTYERMRDLRSPDAPRPEALGEDELRRRFTALRADRIARNRALAQRSLVTSGMTFVVATVLFAAHWRWIRRRGRGLPPAAPSPA